MEKKIQLTLLADFYGPLLTPHQRDVLSLYCEEDMSLQEIADQMGITRQAAHVALKGAQAHLIKYEQTLGLADRYVRLEREVTACKSLLSQVQASEGTQHALQQAIQALDQIDGIER